MKVTISRSIDYIGKDQDLVESVDITVEGETFGEDSAKKIAETYLGIRAVLKEGMEKGEAKHDTTDR